MEISLQKDNIILKQLDPSQAEVLLSLIEQNREYLGRWFSWVEKTNTVEDAKNFLQNEMEIFIKGEGIYFGIWYENELAGIISFNHIHKLNRSATIGYWLGEKNQGKGIMTTACKLLIEYGFNTLKLHRIDISHAVGNERSAKVIKKLGFIHEGHFRKSELVKGEYVDQEYYGLLSNEWSRPG
jgi:ribosomal-protein-serine acetyltransferase